MTEAQIIERLSQRFPYLAEELTSPQPLRIFTGFLSVKQFDEVILFAKNNLGFYRACHVVGTDEGDDLGFLYILADADRHLLILKEKAPKSAPLIHSQTPLFPSLEMHERELVDLFGAQVEDLPLGPRYPLPDDWPEGEYPMRKEWDPKYFNKQTMRYEPPTQEEGTTEHDNI